jgi:hypothetical protein
MKSSKPPQKKQEAKQPSFKSYQNDPVYKRSETKKETLKKEAKDAKIDKPLTKQNSLRPNKSVENFQRQKTAKS